MYNALFVCFTTIFSSVFLSKFNQKMEVDLGRRIGKKVVGFREETGEEACAQGGKIRLMEDEFTPFCRNMAKMEMEEWVRQRKAFVGEMVAKDEGSDIVQ